MAQVQDTMMNPRIEDLMGKVESKFRLVTLAALRARQIASSLGQLGEGLGATIPPQVTSVARKPLSIAFEEISADKIEAVPDLIDEPAGEGADLEVVEVEPGDEPVS
jgi:DNA-directed RNA polymerase subunit omega